jgi:hypothetical protein
MNRRPLLKTVSASIASLYTGARAHAPDALIGAREANQTSARAHPAPEQVLPPASFFPEDYEDVTTDPSGVHTPFYRPREQTAVSYAKLELEAAPSEDGSYTEVRVEVSRVETDQDPTEHVTMLHENGLSGVFGHHEPPPSQFTDWVDFERSEESVDGHRRTVRWVRRPQIFHDLTNSTSGSTKPYHEVAVILQSTSWGLLEVEIEQRDAREEGATLQLAERAIDYMWEQARHADVSDLNDNQ